MASIWARVAKAGKSAWHELRGGAKKAADEGTTAARNEPHLAENATTHTHTQPPASMTPPPSPANGITPSAEELRLLRGHDARVPNAPKVEAPINGSPMQPPMAPVGRTFREAVRDNIIFGFVQGAFRGTGRAIGNFFESHPTLRKWAVGLGVTAVAVPATYMGVNRLVVQPLESGVFNKEDPPMPGSFHALSAPGYVLGYDFDASNGSKIGEGIELGRATVNPQKYIARVDEMRAKGSAVNSYVAEAYKQAVSAQASTLAVNAEAETVKTQSEIQQGQAKVAKDNFRKAADPAATKADLDYLGVPSAPVVTPAPAPGR